MKVLLKKASAILLALSIVIALAACGGSKVENTSAAAVESTAPATTAAATEEVKTDPFKMDQVVTMTVSKGVSDDHSYPEGDDPQNNPVYRNFENNVGVKFVNAFTTSGDYYTPGNAYYQKLKLAIAGNDIPDMVVCDINTMDVLIKNDMVMDLKPAYEKYATDNLKKVVGFRDNIAFTPVADGEKIYAMPVTGDGFNGVSLMYIRQDWLDKLKLQAPKTMEEMFELAKTFAAQDPDGNNKADTLGLYMDKDLIHQTTIQGIMNAYGVYPQQYINGADGKLTYGSLDPKTKDALTKLNELFNAGAIDKEFAIKDRVKAVEKVAEGKIGIYVGEFWSPIWPLADGHKNNPQSDWVAYPMPGSNGSEFVPYSPLPVSYYVALKKGYQYPEAIIKAFNNQAQSFYENDSAYNKEWDRLTMQDEKYKAISAQLNNWAPFYIDSPSKNYDCAQHVKQAMDKDNPNPDACINAYEKDVLAKCQTDTEDTWGTRKIFLEAELAFDNYKNYKTTAYLGGPTDSQVKLAETLNKFETEEFTKMIIKGDIDKEFDFFVKKWYELGGQKILDEMAAAR